MQYILFIQDNLTSESTPEEWERFFAAAKQSGLFQGGSAIGERTMIGDQQSALSTGLLNSQFHSGLRRNESSAFALFVFRKFQHPNQSISYLGHLIEAPPI